MKKWIKFALVSFIVLILAGAGIWIWQAGSPKQEAKAFAWPIKVSENQKIRINRDFGMTFNPIAQYETDHTGLEIDATVGDKVYASRDGIVEFSKWHGGYGQSVMIDHGDGYKTLYGHLDSTFVKNSQTVKKGCLIGLVGSTGYSLDDQLSFSMIKDGKFVNPKSLLPELGGFDVVTPKPATNKKSINSNTGFACPFKKDLYPKVDLTPGFGNRINPINNIAEFHTGIDICIPFKAEILAVYPGKVTIARWYGAYGNIVEIMHDNGAKSRYSHMEELLVKEGDNVAIGQTIGLCGSTGYSTGPHLHFEIMKGKDFLDPMKFVNFR